MAGEEDEEEKEDEEVSFTPMSRPILETSIYEPSFSGEETQSPRDKLNEFSGFKGYQSHSPFARNPLAGSFRPDKTVLYPKSATSCQCMFKRDCP